MLWKIGCAAFAVGLLLTAGSCYFFGTAAGEAARERLVAVAAVTAGEKETSMRATTDAASPVQVRFRVELVLSEAFVERETYRVDPVGSSLPVNYRVLDNAGAVLLRGAGQLRCRQPRVAEGDTTAEVERLVDCGHESERFEGSADGHLEVVASLPAADEYGNRVRIAEIEVYDQLGESAGRRTVTGLLTLLSGQLALALGVVLGLAALVMAAVRKRNAKRAAKS